MFVINSEIYVLRYFLQQFYFINGVAIEIFSKGGTFSDARGATNLRMTCIDGRTMERYNTDKSYVIQKKVNFYESNYTFTL